MIEGLYKRLLQLENGGHRHQNHQDLPGGKAPAHQHVPQPAGAAALVKDLDLKGGQHVPDAADHGVAGRVLNEAVLHRDDGVAARLIDPAGGAAPMVQGKGRVDLVAVAEGLCHAPDGLHMAELSQQRDAASGFLSQLLFIGQLLQLAAAAFFIVRTGGRKDSFHSRRTSCRNHNMSYYNNTIFPVCKGRRL